MLGKVGFLLSADAIPAKERCAKKIAVWNRTSGAKALVSVRDSTVRLRAATFQNSSRIWSEQLKTEFHFGNGALLGYPLPPGLLGSSSYGNMSGKILGLSSLVVKY
jgi:hypothetical protein